MLGFLWGQWASLGVRASAFSHSNLAVDPEALLLLTLECARWDARFFDEVMDWLTVNHRWINVVRLGALAERDAICSRSVLGAVAAFLAKSDRTPKWRSLAEKSRPVDVGEPREFFQNVLKGPVEFPGAADELWLKYGWKRPAVEAREGPGTVTLDEARFMAPTSFFLRARGLFGVNIRADAFAYLAIQSQGANPTKIARELGYSQRRVYDAVIEMASAGAFISHTDGKSITYKIAPNFLSAFGFAEAPEWFDWRALARSWSGIWRGVFGLREGALTPFVLESELQKILVAIENDVARFQSSAVSVTSDQVSRSGRRLLEVTRIPFAAFDWKRRWICREGENDWPAGLQEQLLKRWAEGDYHSGCERVFFSTD